MDVKKLDELIAFQDKFIKMYTSRYGEQPFTDIEIRKALLELKEVKEREKV